MDLGPPRQRAVFAVLALRPNSATPTDRIIEGVWSERSPTHAANLVHKYVSGLRRILAAKPCAAAIERAPEGYVLSISPAGRDLDVFQELVRTARQSPDPEHRAELFETALGLWRGPLLDGIHSELIAQERRLLEEERLVVLEEYAELLGDIGRHHTVPPLIRKELSEHPLRESLHRLLITALYRSGRTAEALDAYRSLRDLLSAELGVPPSPELVSLYERILNRDPSLRAPAPTSAVPRARSSSPRVREADTAAFPTPTGPVPSKPAQRLLSLLERMPGRDFSVHSAAAVGDVTTSTALRMLDELVSLDLVEECPGYRYCLLSRPHRAGSVSELPDDALDRLLSFHTAMAEQAARVYQRRIPRLPASLHRSRKHPPLFVAPAQALRWMAAEHHNIHQALAAGARRKAPGQHVWDLVNALRWFSWTSDVDLSGLETDPLLKAAEDTGDVPTLMAVYMLIASRHSAMAEPELAIRNCARALELHPDSGHPWPAGLADAHASLGNLLWLTGRLAEADVHLRAACRIHEKPGGEEHGITLMWRMRVLHDLGRLADADTCGRIGLAELEHAYSPLRRALMLTQLAVNARALGRAGDARHYAQEALDLDKQTGSTRTSAFALALLALLDAESGAAERALERSENAREALAHAGDLRMTIEVDNMLGSVHLELGDISSASQMYWEAHRLAVERRFLRGRLIALCGIARVHLVSGRLSLALDACEQVLTLASRNGYQIIHGQALEIRGAVRDRLNGPDAAAEDLSHAFSVYTGSGYAPGLRRLSVAR